MFEMPSAWFGLRGADSKTTTDRHGSHAKDIELVRRFREAALFEDLDWFLNSPAQAAEFTCECSTLLLRLTTWSAMAYLW